MEINADSLGTYVPYYLSREKKEGLINALSDFRTREVGYYINQYKDEMLQGDGWSGMEVISFDNGERNRIRGIVLSNTCDISPENKRDTPSKIVFSPIIKLAKYGELLVRSGIAPEKIASKFDAIRKQNITTVFYLPKGDALDDEYIALLDDVHTVPSGVFQNVDSREKLFTLSMIGFYLFLLKLSVHFCRFHEEVDR